MNAFIHRTARFLLEIVGVAVGGVLVLGGVAIWRVSANPVGLSFIRPYVEQEINAAGLGITVEVTGAKLGWRRFRPILDLHVHGVKVLGKAGVAVGQFRDATLGLSVRDLLLGHVALIEIDIDHPQITIVRDAGEHFFLSLGGAAAAPPGDESGDIMSSFIDAPGEGGPIGQLQRLHLVDGSAIVEDRKLGLTWRAPEIDIDISRSPGATLVRVRGALDMPNSRARLGGEARYDRASGMANLALDIENFDASAAAPLAQTLSPLAPLAVPVSGHVHAVIDRTGDLVSGDASLTGGEGQVVLPAFYAQPLAVRSMGLDLHFTDSPKQLILDRLAIDLADTRVQAVGTARFYGSDIALEATADLANIPLARFDALWPRGVAVGGRDWVTTHIPEGQITTGVVKFRAAGQAADIASIEVEQVDGSFDYTGLEVHYLPALPPVRAIAGHASFDGSHMELSIDSGMLDDIAVSHGAVTLTGFDQDARAADIALDLDGPLRTALTVLDMKPLGYAHDLGIPPSSVEGRLAARASFALPLVKTLAFSQIALGAKGRLDGVSVQGAIGPRAVTDGALAIAVDKKGMTLDGGARLAGVPLTMSWRESFMPADRLRTRIAFKTNLDEAALAALSFAPPDLVGLRGMLPITGTVAIDRARTATIDLSADIAAAQLTVDRLGWRKPAAHPGTAAGSLVFTGDVLTRIPSLRIESKDLTLAGNAEFGPDGGFRRAALSRIVDRRNDYALTVEAAPDEPRHYAVRLTGAQLDAAPLIAGKNAGSANGASSTVDITIGVDHLLTGADSRLDSVVGSLSLSEGALAAANIKAVAGGAVTLVYAPRGDAAELHFSAADAGRTLAGLGLTRGVRGGILEADGRTTRSGVRAVTSGTIDLKDFRLTDAPIAARLLNAISLTGFVDLLSGQGLAFDRLSSDFDFGDGKITLRNGRSVGALGISFEGDVDLDDNRVALRGTIVPVDTLNSVVAAIPLLGDVLTGGARGGLLGWTYTVSGAADDPKVSVNPLSMFVPGFLRNLFFLGPSEKKPPAGAAPDAPAQQAPEPQAPAQGGLAPPDQPAGGR